MSNGWPLVPMEDIFEIARGGSPRPIDSFLTDDPDGVNWVMISDATESGKYINSTKKRIREEGVKRSRVVQPGDFLLTNSMSFGRPYIMNTSGCIHDGWLVLSPRNQNVSPDFFYHLLGSDFVYAEFVRRAAGATVKNLNIELVKGVQVPLPPMPEQRRIAEVLDRAEALRAKRRDALTQLDTLTQSIFLDLFGHPIVSRSVWPISTLSEACEKISDGTHHSPPITPNGVPYITAKHLKEHGLDFESDPWFVSEDDHRHIFSRCDPKAGDVLYIKDGATTGIAAVNRYAYEFSMLSSLALLRPNVSRLDATYLCSWLNNPLVKREILGDMAGAAIRRLTLAKIKAVRIPLPPLSLQSKYARRVAAVEKLNAAHRASLSELDALFAVLQHRDFQGEL
ncbi:MAG: restriction endonuclease subunit S [Candidatus Sulfotelmatobacter sp.]